MLDFIAKIKKRGKRPGRRKNKGNNTTWGFNQQQLFKSHTDVGKLYVVENYGKKQDKKRFPK